MLKYRVLCAVGFLLLVTACNSWPPFESKAQQHFAENRESFEQLAEKMRGTDYWRVSIRGQTDVDVTPSADSDYEEQFVIDDDTEWRELLADVGMFMVLQADGAVWTDPGTLWGEHENQMGHNGFTHNPKMLDEFKICQPEYEDIPCGRCAVPLEGDWYIHYIWYPEYFSREEWDSYLEGEIPLDEYSESVEIANRQCHIDGYTEMGYDIGKIFDLDGS